MRALTVEFLEPGALPLYAVDCRLTHTIYDRIEPAGRWEPCGRFGQGRVLIQLWEEDVMLADLRDKLTGWISQLGDPDGSLIFPIRGIATLPGMDDRPAYGPFVMAGLSFIPEIDFGWPLNGDDPVDIIVQTCEADGVDFDGLHPAAQQARQRRVEQRVRWEAEMVKDKAKRRVVDARSLALLRDCLTSAQLDELETYGMFHVTGGDGYTYAIERDYGSVVHRVEDGLRTVSYCIHAKDHLPSYDLMLGIKFMLEAAPERFHATANYIKLVS